MRLAGCLGMRGDASAAPAGSRPSSTLCPRRDAGATGVVAISVGQHLPDRGQLRSQAACGSRAAWDVEGGDCTWNFDF